MSHQQPSESAPTLKSAEANTIGKHPRLFPYVIEHAREHPLQAQLRDEIAAKERAVMAGSPEEAQFLGWLLRLTGAKKCLEIGVFRGSTTLALALALPADGKVVGLDISEEFAATAKPYWARAGVDGKIDLKIGQAVESLDKLIADGQAGTFDMAFIDADKVNYIQYYERALVLLKPGGIIASDNCLWSGLVHPLAADADADTRTLAQLNTIIKNDKRVDPVMLPIADGVYLARKL